jgi:prophage regulatory protein
MQNQNISGSVVSPEVGVYIGLRLSDVMGKVKMSRGWIYGRIQDRTFPAPIKLGRASVWIECEVNQWMAEQIQKSRNLVKVAV